MAAKTTLDSDDYFEHVPTDISKYPTTSALRMHALGVLAWAHQPGSPSALPHAHLIREDWSSDQKNQMAGHIEYFHKHRKEDQ